MPTRLQFHLKIGTINPIKMTMTTNILVIFFISISLLFCLAIHELTHKVFY